MRGSTGNPPLGDNALSQGLNALSLNAPKTAATVGPDGAAPVPSITLVNDPPIDFGELSACTNPPPPAEYMNGNAVKLSSTSGKLQPLVGKLDYPVRTSIVAQRNQQLLTNHFQLHVDPKTTFYEYQLTGFSETETRAGKKRLMRTAVQSIQFLRDNQDSFATDDVNTIISWVKLHDKIPTIRLHAGHLPDNEGSEWRLIDVVDKDVTHRLNLHYLRQVDIDGLRAYSKTEHSNPSAFDTNPAENALNIVIRKCVSANNTLHLNGHKFYLQDAWLDLAPLQSLRGFIYAVKLAMGNIFLNMVPTMSAFWRPLLVSEVLQKHMNTFGGDQNALRGVRVYIIYERGSESAAAQSTDINGQHSRIKVIRGFGLPCDQQTFRYQGVDKNGNALPPVNMTVADYRRQIYRKPLDKANLMAVNIYAKPVPERVADIFHRQSITSPQQTRARVAEGLSHMPINAQGQLIGCTALSLDTRMVQLAAARLPYPRINYAPAHTNTTVPLTMVNESSGRWNLANVKFHRGSGDTLNWKLLVAPSVEPKDNTNIADRFIKEFNSTLKETGVCSISIHQGAAATLSGLDYDSMQKALRNIADDSSTRTPDFVVLLLERKNQNAYACFKYLTDKVFVVHFICASAQTFARQTDTKQYLANIAMKANLKKAGVNHTTNGIAEILKETLVLGADVTHPGGGALKGTPSIAAVVGSYEDNGGRFIGRMELQTAKEEMIQKLSKMVQDILDAWQAKHVTWPKNVIYYRDGVSNSQYDQVVSVELPQILRAFTNVGAVQPNLTAVVATKRHSTRFFPQHVNQAMKNGNTKPGTLVETTVTSPYYGDFYLQSHHAIKGTARPCHYFILRNDMGIDSASLQSLTFNLCHTYVRATVGVSYAVPAYYADRLCELGRTYLRDFYSPDRADRDNYNRERADYQEGVENRRSQLNQNRPARGRNTKKTKAEIDDAKADAEEVDEHMTEWLNEDIEQRWNAQAYSGEAEARKNAFHMTMYWM